MSRLAGVLVKNGVGKGDLVVIYMPMVPQAMFAMLACARIGAPHSLIFGGFASKELSVRIDHAKVRQERRQGEWKHGPCHPSRWFAKKENRPIVYVNNM